MTELSQPTSTQTAVNLLLSHEEVRYLLDLLQVTTLPGLEDAGDDALSAAEQTLVRGVAERALLARQLIQRQPDGAVKIHNKLVALLGACAFATDALFAYHWGNGQDLPTPAFVHSRGDGVIVHSRPVQGLHQFTRLPTVVDAVPWLMALCEIGETPPVSPVAWQMPATLLGQVRTLVQDGSTQSAVERLRAYTAEIAANALVETLADGLRVSNLQRVARDNGGVRQTDVIVLQNQRHLWTVHQVDGGKVDGGQVHVRTASSVDVSAWLHAQVTAA
ncbi:hypothetical protein GC175_06650 [bacterium]|nr:hypothetical protein [bacterium]